jgi:hypothetical protein
LEWVELPFHLQIQAFGSGIELNAIQRSNPNAKRAANAIRGLVESDHNQLFLFT